MAKSLDRISFLSKPTRFKIAEFCDGEWRTLDEIGAMLDRAPGSLSQPKTMRKEGALKTKSRLGADGRGGTEARAYRLNPSWRNVLEMARTRQRPELPAVGQELLLIPLAATSAACAKIVDGIDEVEWGARLTGETFGLLLAPAADATGASTSRVLEALGPVGHEARRLHLKEVMSPAGLQSWSRSVASRSSNELPDGE